MAAPAYSSRRRVKVYNLDEGGQWKDVGTGYVQCMYQEKYDGASLVVTSESEAKEILLDTRIYAEDIYQCQQDTLIVWSDPITGKDLALSFQEQVGCNEIWCGPPCPHLIVS